MKGRELTIDEVVTLPIDTTVWITNEFWQEGQLRQIKKRVYSDEKYLTDGTTQNSCDLTSNSAKCLNLRIYEWKEDVEMKTYTTLEMMKIALENTDKIFETIGCNNTKIEVQAIKSRGQYSVQSISGGCTNEDLPYNDTTSKYIWNEVAQAVDFMTAVNSGKRIKREGVDCFMTLGYVIDELGEHSSDAIRTMINSKEWYIED